MLQGKCGTGMCGINGYLVRFCRLYGSLLLLFSQKTACSFSRHHSGPQPKQEPKYSHRPSQLSNHLNLPSLKVRYSPAYNKCNEVCRVTFCRDIYRKESPEESKRGSNGQLPHMCKSGTDTLCCLKCSHMYITWLMNNDAL